MGNGSATYGSTQPGRSADDPLAQEVDTLLEYGLSDRSYQSLIDFYQQQVDFYSDRQGSQTILGRLIDRDRPDPRELAWEDLQRVAQIYRELSDPGDDGSA